jgi:hypothetical protein
LCIQMDQVARMITSTKTTVIEPASLLLNHVHH